MISFCIPVFNYDVRPLVSDIHAQALAAGKPFEILIFDDGSDQACKSLNSELQNLHNTIYIELPENIGRSRIRNLLAEKAQYHWLVFLDCDSKCPDQKFVERYIECASGEFVICGGTLYPDPPPADDTYLHWYFGRYREAIPLQHRLEKPELSFKSNNFMIPKKIFQQVAFNDNLSGYGHEDTLFGYELLKKNIEIKHCDNPVIHLGLYSSEDFLARTFESTYNLYCIYKMYNGDSRLLEMVRLLKVFDRILRFRLSVPVALLFRIFRKSLEKRLTGKNPQLVYLDLYKLGSICFQAGMSREKT